MHNRAKRVRLITKKHFVSCSTVVIKCSVVIKSFLLHMRVKVSGSLSGDQSWLELTFSTNNIIPWLASPFLIYFF